MLNSIKQGFKVVKTSLHDFYATGLKGSLKLCLLLETDVQSKKVQTQLNLQCSLFKKIWHYKCEMDYSSSKSRNSPLIYLTKVLCMLENRTVLCQSAMSQQPACCSLYISYAINYVCLCFNSIHQFLSENLHSLDEMSQFGINKEHISIYIQSPQETHGEVVNVVKNTASKLAAL